MNNVSLEVGTWVGGKAVPCTVPAFDMGAIVSLNSISTKQAGFRKILSNEITVANVTPVANLNTI